MSRAGGCLCGAVRYTVEGSLRHILVCHCVECRRWAGHAWAATAARLDEITVAGDVSWRPSPRSEYSAERGNCRRCGSTLFWRAPGARYLAIGVGSVDDPSGLEVVAHIWVDHALEWERPAEGVPAYPRGYPRDAPPPAWS